MCSSDLRGAAGLGKGFLTEGGTEAVQEMSSAAAEKFVDNNQEFFTPKNFVRFLDAGLKGGLGGGVITGVSDIAFGRAPTKAEEPGAAPSLQDVADLEKQILAKEGITLPEAPAAPAAPTAPVTEGAPDVRQPVTETSGAGVPVPEPASTIEPPAPGVTGVERPGVVPAGADVTKVAEGKGREPATVTIPTVERSQEQIIEDGKEANKASNRAFSNTKPIEFVPIMAPNGNYTVPLSAFGDIDVDKIIPGHSQSLRRLIQRGGVSVREAANIIKNGGTSEGFEEFRNKSDQEIFAEFPQLYKSKAVEQIGRAHV